MIGQLVSETIGLIRAYKCSHKWGPHSATEEQCKLCGIIATPEGKANLAAESRRRGFLAPESNAP